jgi:spermidine synthase
VIEIALHPLGLLLVCGLVIAAAVGSMQAGLLRSAAVLGLGCALLACFTPQLVGCPDRRIGPLCLGSSAAALIGLAGAHGLVAAREVRRVPGEVVYATVTDRVSLTVTSAQASFAVFLDGALKFTTVDERRYYERLVHPALVAAPRRGRVLLLGSGDGLAEREILRHPDVQRLTLVVLDRTLADLSSRLSFLRTLGGSALRSPRVHIVEREPIVWLETTSETFDVAIVDLPDPQDYRQAKNYTRYFYQQLAARLAPGGVAMVQATSPFKSPEAFATIRRTLEAAGLVTLPCRAPVPLLGEWGFILASRGPIEMRGVLPPGLVTLDAATLATAFTLPPDTAASEPGQVSTLDDQPLVELMQP